MNKTILILLLTVFFLSCRKKAENKQTENQTQEQIVLSADDSTVNVYYFHGKQRCRTCIDIENVTKNTVTNIYTENPKVRYIEVNIDDKQNKDLVEKYEIAFSSLVIAKGENSIDLTDQAFANAVNSRDILTNLIQAEVNKRID